MADWPNCHIADGAALLAALPTWALLARRYLPILLLAALLVLLLIKARGLWQEIREVEEPILPGDLLQTFEQAHADGELDDEEFERVKLRLKAFPEGVGDTSSQQPARAAPRRSEPRSPLDRVETEPDQPVDDLSP